MARIRTVKPDFFRHAGLFAAEKKSGLPLRLAFIGLWTAADRDGRFKWVPPTLKLDALPFDDVSFSDVLDALADAGFIVKYEVDGRTFGSIPSWDVHQHINARESQSVIPRPPLASTCVHVHAHGEGKGREGKESREGKDASATRWPPGAIVPDDWITDAEQARIEHGLPAINLRLEATKFANYWPAANGRNAAKLDWKRTWMNWCLDESKQRQRGRAVSSEHPGGIFGELTDRLREREGPPPHRR